MHSITITKKAAIAGLLIAEGLPKGIEGWRVGKIKRRPMQIERLDMVEKEVGLSRCFHLPCQLAFQVVGLILMNNTTLGQFVDHRRYFG